MCLFCLMPISMAVWLYASIFFYMIVCSSVCPCPCVRMFVCPPLPVSVWPLWFWLVHQRVCMSRGLSDKPSVCLLEYVLSVKRKVVCKFILCVTIFIVLNIAFFVNKGFIYVIWSRWCSAAKGRMSLTVTGTNAPPWTPSPQWNSTRPSCVTTRMHSCQDASSTIVSPAIPGPLLPPLCPHRTGVTRAK